MKKLIFFLALAAFGQQTGYKFNPFTGNLDLAGNGFTAPSGYSTSVTSGVTLTVAAATHGQGTTPVAFCFDSGTPATAVACSYTVSATGEVVLTTPVFTGAVIIRGPGATAGAAGNVVGPTSSTNGSVAYYSGTGGKTLAGSATFCWDAVNGRLGVGTCSPLGTASIAGDIASQPTTGQYGQLEIVGATNSAKRLSLGYNTTGNVGFIQALINAALFSPLTLNSSGGNVLVGGTTDGNYKLDVQGSGTTGTFRVYDQTATTGTTKAVFRAGAGQSGNILEVQNSAGTVLSYIASGGDVSAPSFRVTGRGYIYAPADGIFRLTNDSVSDFNRLQFGGTTSSFPALKRSGTELQSRLADDSAFASFQALYLQSTGVTVASLPAAAGGNAGAKAYVTDANATTIGSTVAGGGANKVLVWSNGTAWKIYAN